MLRATRLLRTCDGRDSKTAVEEVSLSFDERHRRRIRMTTVSGKAFLLDLPKTRALADGDLLELEDGSLVRVAARPETVADICCEIPDGLTRIAWHLGNRHWPTQVLAESLRIRHDHVLVDMVRGLGGEVTVREAPFQPEGGAYAGDHDH
ncbi:MAG: urease accessory protein UreE [Pseudomonadota bacterium]